MTQLTVHQCPYCELRFGYANDLKDHVVTDHPDHAAELVAVEFHEIPR